METKERMTIKQVADMLHLSKNTVKYRMKKLPDDTIIREDGVIYISKSGIDLLSKGVSAAPIGAADQPVMMSGNDNLSIMIDKLSSEIEFLREQLKTKDNQIEELTTSLKAEQTISIQYVGLLRQKEETILKLEAEQSKKSKGWFSFFRKNASA